MNTLGGETGPDSRTLLFGGCGVAEEAAPYLGSGSRWAVKIGNTPVLMCPDHLLIKVSNVLKIGKLVWMLTSLGIAGSDPPLSAKCSVAMVLVNRLLLMKFGEDSEKHA